MNLSRLKRASSWEVEQWMISDLNLTAYQIGKLRENEVVRFSPFYFYKQTKVKSSVLWRLTLPLYLVYWGMAVVFMPLNFLISGHWGYGRKFIDKFHSPWVRKIGL